MLTLIQRHKGRLTGPLQILERPSKELYKAITGPIEIFKRAIEDRPRDVESLQVGYKAFKE